MIMATNADPFKCVTCDRNCDGRSYPVKCVQCYSLTHKGCAGDRANPDNFICNTCSTKDLEVKSAGPMPTTSVIATKQDIQEVLEEIRGSRAEFRALDKKIQDVVTILNVHKVELDGAIAHISRHDRDIQRLNDTVEYMSEYSRRNSLEFHGIPQERNEDFFNIMKRFGDLINLRIGDGHIDAFHRLPSQSASKPIIVKFLNRWMKEEILNNKATKTIMAKDLGFDYSPLRVYVNENLTPAKRKLAKETRMSFKELGCSVWVRNSKIFVEGGVGDD